MLRHGLIASPGTPHWPTSCRAPSAAFRYRVSAVTRWGAKSSASSWAASSPWLVAPATESSRAVTTPTRTSGWARSWLHALDASGELGNRPRRTSSGMSGSPSSSAGTLTPTIVAATSTSRTLCSCDIARRRAKASSRVIPWRSTSTPLACSITARSSMALRSTRSSSRVAARASARAASASDAGTPRSPTDSITSAPLRPRGAPW